MKIVVISLAGLFCLVGMVFSYLPMGTIALLPVGIAAGLSILAIRQDNNKKFPKIILGITIMSFLFVIGKSIFVKDEVVQDVNFEQQKMQQKQEAQQELEELENDLE